MLAADRAGWGQLQLVAEADPDPQLPRRLRDGPPVGPTSTVGGLLIASEDMIVRLTGRCSAPSAAAEAAAAPGAVAVLPAGGSGAKRPVKAAAAGAGAGAHVGEEDEGDDERLSVLRYWAPVAEQAVFVSYAQERQAQQQRRQLRASHALEGSGAAAAATAAHGPVPASPSPSRAAPPAADAEAVIGGAAANGHAAASHALAAAVAAAPRRAASLDDAPCGHEEHSFFSAAPASAQPWADGQQQPLYAGRVNARTRQVLKVGADAARNAGATSCLLHGAGVWG